VDDYAWHGAIILGAEWGSSSLAAGEKRPSASVEQEQKSPSLDGLAC
jgi:hypothetical protein